MKPIDAAGFEQKFRENVDPWDYENSPFEAFKRRVLLRACGDRIHGRGLELACANGATTRHLAARCLRLLAVDASPTALREARRRNRGQRIVLRQALLPQDMPRGPFDLIVVSEILYYLAPNAMRDLLQRLERASAPGGRIVVLHHIHPFDDAAQLPSLVQRKASAHFKRLMQPVFHERHARFDALAFRTLTRKGTRT